MKSIVQAFSFAAAILLAVCANDIAVAELYINEIYFDPPSDTPDIRQEYIELRGTPGMSLNNHYLVFLENEDTSTGTGTPGQIDLFFDLTGRSLSPTTGFFSMRQENSDYSNVPTNDYNIIDTDPDGFGWGTNPTGANPDNNIGAWSLPGDSVGRIENSGFTAMIVRRNGSSVAPTLGQRLDGFVDNDNNAATPNDGLDHLVTNAGPDWKIVNAGSNIDWTIIDSIGIYSEMSEAGGDIGEAFYGRTYAKINYGPEIPGETYHFNENQVPTSKVFQPNIGPGQSYVGVGYEIELAARWGNSTGQTSSDWHISNVTDNPVSGFAGLPDDGFRQSGLYHDSPPNNIDDFVETNQFVPYGANLTNTIGAANYPLNLSQLPWDYNRDNAVDALDYVIWRLTYGSTTDLSADGNGGRQIEDDDFLFWAGRYGIPVGGLGAGTGANAVPEPATLCTVMLAGLGVLCFRRSRR